MKATILNIGDELLIGQVVNTNASLMAQMLTTSGIEVCGIYTIGDNAAHIRLYLQHCLSCSEAVLITGGLGPTKDDITKSTLCQFFGSHLYENAQVLANISRIFAARGYELTPLNRQQAWVPECCTVLNNPLGTAPGMWLEQGAKVVVSLPGVPFEMLNLMQTEVLPRLQEHFCTGQIISKNILTQGIGESFLSDLIEPWEAALPPSIRLAYLPQAGMVKLRLTARGGHDQRPLLQKQIDAAVVELCSIAREYIVGEDVESLPQLVADIFLHHHLTLATAESCTGGALASQLTAMAGASQYYRGGVVAYCNEVKEHALGVKPETLAAHTAVSQEVVREMALGARERFGSDFAVATTGVAGPSGGSPQCPVGTVWIGIAAPCGQTFAHLLHLGDRRAQNIERTTHAVWAELVRVVKSVYPD